MKAAQRNPLSLSLLSSPSQNSNNEENEMMPSTVPLLVGFTRPENSTDNTGSDFVIGAWIPETYQNKVPTPREDAGIEVARYSRETYFVANWTGAPATAGTVAMKADELSKALDDNKVHCFLRGE